MITLYDENDVQIRDIRIYEINDADMGESTITATVKFDQVMQFHPDWYVLLNGEKYKLGITEPSGKRSTTRINVEYTLTFHSSREDLKRYTFMDFVEYGSGNPQPSQHTFSLQACTLGQLVNRFNINLQYYLGSLWTMELSDDADPSIVADLSFDKASLWDVLLELYKDYGVRWTIHSDEGYMTILVGEDATELQTIFEYGKGNGLISVERTNPTERIVTRLRGKGSEKNLPANYFHAATSAFPIADPDTNNILQGIFYNRLYPKCYRDYVRGYNSGEEDEEETWAYQQGVADKVAGKPMNIVDFAKSDNEDLWGISYGAVEDNDEIFPTLQGATRSGVELDKVLAVSPIYVDAPDDGEAARQFTQVNGAKGSFQGRDLHILYNYRDGGISSVVGISNAKSATADSATFTLETAINTVRAKFLVTPTKFADFYANVVGVTAPESPTLTTVAEMVANNWNFVERLQLINATTNVVVRTWNGNNQDFFDVVADDIPAGTYKFRSYIQWYKTTGATQDKLLYTIDWQLYGCEYASYQNASSKKTFSETFDIWIGNVWNTTPYENESDEAYACRVWAPLVSKEEMTVMFSDGLLAGEDYEFPIVGLVNGSDNLAEIIKKAIHYDTSVTGSHWRLTLQKSDAEFEASGKYLPNSVINVLPGNHFFFINIQMPYDPYIYDAERRQQEYLENQLSLLDVEQPTFAVVPSSVFMASLDEVDDVVPGNKIRLRDVSLIGSSYTTAYIQSISKRYTETKINPDWSLVVSDQIIVNGNPITLIEGKVDALSKQMYSSKQAIKDAIEAFAQFYLRKDGLPDASFSATDFRAPVTFRDRITDYNFRQGDFGGYGFGVYTDPDGNRVVEADVLVGRMALRVNELVVNQVEYVGGQKIYSAAAMTVSKVESTTTIWRCYFDNKQGAVRNMFLAGDLAFCQRFNGTEEGGYTTYWAKVTAIGSDYIELSKTDIMSAGSGSPAVGDNIIQLGNASDQDRQSAIILSSYGANSPSIRLYHGITGYTLANKDVFGVEYDSTNHIPYFYNYGSMRLGARESDANGQFITYNHLTGTLNIRAKVNFIGGSSGLTNLTEYPGLNARINTAITAAAAAQEIMEALNDDSIFDNVEKRSVRRQWEAINGAASTTSTGTTGSYHQTITDFDSYAFPTQQALFTFNGVTYTYAQKGLLHTAIGIDDLIEKYTNLRNYLDLVGLYDDEEYTDFSPSTLGTKLTAYYDAEQHVRNEVDLDNKQKFDTLSYLRTYLEPSDDITTIDGGIVLSSFVGVRTNDLVVAALNATDLGANQGDKLLIYSGVKEPDDDEEEYEDLVKAAKFRVYYSGHVEADDIYLNSGVIGGWSIQSNGIYDMDSSAEHRMKITKDGCYFTNTQIEGSLQTRCSGSGVSNYLSLAQANGQPLIRINSAWLSTNAYTTYLYLTNGTTIVNTSAGGWWSTLTVDAYYDLLDQVLPTAYGGTLSIPSFNLYRNFDGVIQNFTVEVLLLRWFGGSYTVLDTIKRWTNLGSGSSTLATGDYSREDLDNYYSYSIVVHLTGKVQSSLGDTSRVKLTVDKSAYGKITYGDTVLTKGIFLGANGIDIAMGDYQKFQYITRAGYFAGGNIYGDNRDNGGQFEVSFKTDSNDSIGMRIQGYYDAAGNIGTNSKSIRINLGDGNGWRKLTVTSDGTLKLA